MLLNLENIESVFGSQSASDFNFFHKDCKKLFNSFDKSFLQLFHGTLSTVPYREA